MLTLPCSDMFRLIADQQRRSNQKKLALLLSDCIQVPRVLGEIAGTVIFTHTPAIVYRMQYTELCDVMEFHLFKETFSPD
jgi:hypothetical protein